MHYGKICISDISNGPGCRVSLFVSGCRNHCKGCFNQETWDFSYGRPFTADIQNYLLTELMKTGCAGLSILGGEPMELENQEALFPFIDAVKALRKNIWLYTGFTLEELTDEANKRCRGPYTDKILSLVDVLVDGRFIEDQKDISLQFRGSRNQRIIEMRRGAYKECTHVRDALQSTDT